MNWNLEFISDFRNIRKNHFMFLTKFEVILTSKMYAKQVQNTLCGNKYQKLAEITFQKS